MWLGCLVMSNWLKTWFISRLGKWAAPFSLSLRSSMIGMTCLVRLMALFPAVISTFIRICVGSTFGVMTMFETVQLLGPFTLSMWSVASNSVNKLVKLVQQIVCEAEAEQQYYFINVKFNLKISWFSSALEEAFIAGWLH